MKKAQRVELPPNTHQPDDSPSEQAVIKGFPKLDETALYGLAGEFSKFATTSSEADPAAVLITMLTFAGAAFGTNCFVPVGPSKHYPRLFSAIVGASSRARKGTSLEPVRLLFDTMYKKHPTLDKLPVMSGPLSSGEGLIAAVRDPSEEMNDKGEPVDKGVEDKRLLVTEAEFGGAIKIMRREGNTLSAVARQAFDTGTLAPMTKHHRIKSTNAHICILGHVTYQELSSRLSESDDIYNGFANRFLWICARRQRVVAIPKTLDDQELMKFADRLATSIETIEHRGSGPSYAVRFSGEARKFWCDIYPALSTDEPGALGAVTARAEAITLRLALIYALIDGSDSIAKQHIIAALALWEYGKDSARYLFGAVQENPVSAKILDLLDDGPKTQTDISHHFDRNLSSTDLGRALLHLQNVGRITQHSDKSKPGRPTTYWQLSTGFVPTN